MSARDRSRWTRWIWIIIPFVCLCILMYTLFPLNRDKVDETLSGDPLGMVLIDIQDQEASAFYHVKEMGVYVLAVDEGSPAYVSGIRSGDRVISINGADVSSIAAFTQIRENVPLSETIEIAFDSGGRTITAEWIQE